MKLTDLPRLRLAWLNELGVEAGRTLSPRPAVPPTGARVAAASADALPDNRARPPGAAPSTPAAMPERPAVVDQAPSAAPDDLAVEQRTNNDRATGPGSGGTTLTTPAAPVSTAPAADAAAQRTVGTLVARVYRPGRAGPAWLVVVDMQELGPKDSGQRLFLGRMLRAVGLRRGEGGADVAVHESPAGIAPVSLDQACGDVSVNGILLIGGLAARAVVTAGPASTPVAAFGQRELPVAVLSGLADVSAGAAAKATAWRALCGLRSRL